METTEFIAHLIVLAFSFVYGYGLSKDVREGWDHLLDSLTDWTLALVLTKLLSVALITGN